MKLYASVHLCFAGIGWVVVKKRARCSPPPPLARKKPGGSAEFDPAREEMVPANDGKLIAPMTSLCNTRNGRLCHAEACHCPRLPNQLWHPLFCLLAPRYRAGLAGMGQRPERPHRPFLGVFSPFKAKLQSGRVESAGASGAGFDIALSAKLERVAGGGR